MRIEFTSKRWCLCIVIEFKLVVRLSTYKQRRVKPVFDVKPPRDISLSPLLPIFSAPWPKVMSLTSPTLMGEVFRCWSLKRQIVLQKKG